MAKGGSGSGSVADFLRPAISLDKNNDLRFLSLPRWHNLQTLRSDPSFKSEAYLSALEKFTRWHTLPPETAPQENTS